MGIEDYPRHTPGHKLMVQVQSTWFPLIDRNPQKFCNIYEREDSDFQKSEGHLSRQQDLAANILLMG